MMKKLLALVLTLTLLLPVLSLAEEDDEDLDIEEVIEDVVLDDEGNEILVDEETGEVFLLSSADEETLDQLTAQLEIDDTVDSESLEINPNLPEHIINILLMGVDVKGTSKEKMLVDQGKYAKRADVMMILSIDTESGRIMLSSIARNTYVEIPGRKNSGIIANSYGHAIYKNGEYAGWEDTPELCVRTVNHNFEMNIQHYVVINFYGVAQIVEQLGGVDIELTRTEAVAINNYLRKYRKQISNTYDEKKGKREALEKVSGVQHLDGVQALMYARLRSIDSDFVRTARTRNLLDALLQAVIARIKAKELDVTSLIMTAIDYMITNMNLRTIGELAMGVLNSGIMDRLGTTDTLIDQFRIPMDGTYKYQDIDGSSVNYMNAANFQKNKEALHEFIYGRYIPAETSAE